MRKSGFGDTRRPSEKPVEVEVDGHGVERSHPAFGCITVTRPHGRADLFRSSMQVNSFISIEVRQAIESRDLQHSTHYAKGIIASIEMTEAQWAAFVSAVGSGSGVPCTLRYHRDGELVRIPGIDDRSAGEDRSQHIRETVEKRLEALNKARLALKAVIDKPGVVKKSELSEISDLLLRSVGNAASDFQFAADMVTEHMEQAANEVRIELQTYHQMMNVARGVAPMGIAAEDVQLLESYPKKD